MIECCISNVDEAIQRCLRDAEVIKAPCLEHCGICYAEQFLIVDGEIWRGDHEFLLTEIANRKDGIAGQTAAASLERME